MDSLSKAGKDHTAGCTQLKHKANCTMVCEYKGNRLVQMQIGFNSDDCCMYMYRPKAVISE